jgi:putative transcriptional regulator
MNIIIHIDVMTAKRKKRSRELVETIGITEQNLSILKMGKPKQLGFQLLGLFVRH